MTALLSLMVSAVVVATPPAASVDALTPIDGVEGLYAAVGEGSTSIVLAAGTYELDKPLVITTDGTEIVGAAQPVSYDAETGVATAGGATLIDAAGSGQAIVVKADGVTISGVAITGGDAGSKGSGGAIEVARNTTGFVLSDSTIVANTAGEGAGVFVEKNATATIERSTFVGNVTSGKGGGVRVAGSVDVVNSTFTDNNAQSGGAISVAGSAAVSYSTFVDNTSNNSKGGGVDRNGGTLVVTGSILTQANQQSSDGSDCSGTPDLVGVNYVGNDQGCNPGPDTLTRATVGPLAIQPLADNGGPTQTIAQLEGSPSVDIAGLTECLSVRIDGTPGEVVDTDQRGSDRPSTDADGLLTPCDLGAYERATLSIDLALSVDTTNYEPLPPGAVEVGVVSVPTSQIAFELATRTPTNADGTVDNTGLRSIGLRSIGLRSITLEDIGLRSIDVADSGLRSIEVKANGLRSIGLRSIGLRSIGLRSIGLRSIGLRSIPVSDIPLLQDGGWETLFAETDFAGVPLQSITLEDLVQYEIDTGTSVLPDDPPLTLESIDLSSTGLRSIGLRSILLAGVGLRSIPVPPLQTDGNYADEWCQLLFDAETCTPAFVTELAEAELWEAQLAGGDIEQEQVLEVPLNGLASTGLRSIGLRSIGLRSIFLENTGLRSIGLRSIGLRSIDGVTLSTIIDCSAPGTPCSTDPSNTLTLGDAVAGCLPPDVLDSGFQDPTNCLLRDDATVGQLLDLLSVEIDGVSLLDGLTLFDILFAFVAPEDVPWEVIELDGALLQNVADPPQPTFDYVTEITVREGPADITVDLFLPEGFAVAAGTNAVPARLCSSGACAEVVPRSPLQLGHPTYDLADVPSGTHTLRVPVRAGLTVGSPEQFPTTVTALAVGPNGSPPLATAGPVGVEVVEAAAGGPGRAPTLVDGQLQLGHIATVDDIDLYSFTAPTGTTGASARILLSNIPEPVDYDLSVYGPRPASLRGAPTDELSTLVEASFDLNPDDDVLPTDVVDDIAIDINELAAGTEDLDLGGVSYALRDISSRRANNDEEVTIPALVEDTTYVIAVSAYFDDLSPDPYGLRVRLDRRTAIPECAASMPYPGATTPVANALVDALSLDGSTNTLYITNLSRLEFESPGSTLDVLDSIAATDGVNGVSAGILQVDDLTEWDTWNANRCDPEARNGVVSAIGDRIDGEIDAVETAGGSIEHIVIVGGDGVIPMAAVPDLTEYSNESTFAREVLTDTNESNEAVAALGSGYLLSDDPYATDAGISILEGDHELYLPDRSIGRLVETADEIIGQLDNFATYDGLLDPSTFDASAAVTSYDFLDDGGQAVIDELVAAGFDVTELRDADVWDRKDFLALFTDTDLSVVSPNAHYDFESLLPAAPDAAGYFTADQLVTTTDLATAGPGTASLIFTVGCHAGFSVSDVQLQNPALDWAQLNAQGSNQFVGHTTYGYGDTKIVAYSERLAQLFAANLGALLAESTTDRSSLGGAVRDAKQQYLAGTLVLTPYDEKILQSWTYYGLPMYTVGDILEPTTETTTSTFAEVVGAETLRTSDLQSGPASFTTPDGTTRVDIDLTGSALDPVGVDEDGDGTDDSTYYQVDGNTIVAQYRPVQPLVDVPIPVDGTYQGFLITGLTSEDLPESYVPFVSRPLVDDSAEETRIVVDDGAFPATLQRVTDVGDGQRLLVAAGQYESGQRLFRQISGELLLRGSTTDDDAPRFLEVEGQRIADVGTTGQGVQFDVVTDGTATRVVVLFREFGATTWTSVELAAPSAIDGERRWFGSAPLAGITDDEVEFFVQSVDAAGNVGVTSNKIENFFTVDADDSDGLVGIEYAGPETQEFDGRFYASGANFVIVPGEADTEFTVDSGPLQGYNPAEGITVVFEEGASGEYDFASGEIRLDRGPHVLFAEDSSGNRVYRFFVLDPDAPTVTFSPDQPTAEEAPWTDGSVDVTISAADGAGAGVASLSYCVAGTCDVAPAGDTSVTVTVDAAGVTEITAVATDLVGNLSGTSSTYVRIDRTAPELSFTPDTDAWSGDDVTVTITATDDQSGVASITSCLDGPCATPTVTAGSSTRVDVTTGSDTIRVATLAAFATDTVGNPSVEQSTTIRIDKQAPTVTDFSVSPDADGDGFYTIGETVIVSFACDDGEGSGVASCELLDGTTPVPTQVQPDGSYSATFEATNLGIRELTVTATDDVGLVAISDRISITVAYGTCLLYDPDQAKNPGSNYTIKLQLCDADGSNLSARQITLTALTVDGDLDPGPNDSGKANDGYEFRYNASDRSYIYNLDTTGLTSDPTPHLLYFTAEPVPDRDQLTIPELQGLATNSAPFTIR